MIEKLSLQNQSPHTQQNKEENYKDCTKGLSARRTPGCRILLIRGKRRNIMHDSVFLQTTAVAEEIHLVCLPLVFNLHLMLLSGEPGLHLLLLSRQTSLQSLCLLLLSYKASPEFIHLLLQLEILLLHFIDLTLQGFLFLL